MNLYAGERKECGERKKERPPEFARIPGGPQRLLIPEAMKLRLLRVMSCV
jgi:hypothetical protein